MNIDGQAFTNMSPEDRIRQLRGLGVDPHGARAASDTQDFTAMHGQPQGAGDAAYGLAMADFLRKRGHNVTVNP
jgi:hypothetical protein